MPTASATVPVTTAVPRSFPARAVRPAAALRAGLFPWAPVLLSAGIALWFALPSPPSRLLWAAFAALAATGVWTAMRAEGWAETGRISWALSDLLRMAGWALVLVAAGVALAGARVQMVAAPVMSFRYYGPVEGRVIEIDRSARDRMRLTLDQVVLRNTPPDRTPERVRLSLMDQAAEYLPEPGQRVMLTGHLGPSPGPAAPGSFDFRAMAWFERLGAVGYARTPVLTVAPPEGGIWRMHRARMAISRAMQDRIGGQKGAVAAALVTGDRSGIHEATNEVMRASNLYHIISISGLHMSMLAGFIYAAVRMALSAARAARLRLPAPVHKIAAATALLAAAAYLWLSGGGVATERAFIMVAVMLVAILADRRAISLRTIAVAAVVILILSPEALTSPGFQMSFAATVALILSAGPWARLSPHLHPWARPVAMLVISSLVAGAATAPLAAAHFSRMAQYGLLANLLAVPVMGAVVMPAGVIAAVLAPLGLAGPALWAMGVGTEWMLIVARFVADLGGSVTAVSLPPWQVLPLMAFGATVAVLSWRRGRMRAPGLPLTSVLAGLTMVAVAFALWLTADRPLILIAPEGEAVGLMTPHGRAASKPAGGAFVVKSWLAEDGDTASQEESAARPAWSGDKRDRRAILPGGVEILHFTGKGAAARALPACIAGRIVVVAAAVERPRAPACLLIDQTSLRRTGALSIDITTDGPIMIRSATEAAGSRPWTGSGRQAAAQMRPRIPPPAGPLRQTGTDVSPASFP